MANQPLPADEIKRRIHAARVLRQLEQADLDRMFHEDGLGKGEAGRTERGDLPLTRVRREAFCRHLGVPERWFLADDVDEVVGLATAGPTDAGSTDTELSPESLRELLEQALDQLAQAAGQDQPGSTTRPADSGHQGRASGGAAA